MTLNETITQCNNRAIILRCDTDKDEHTATVTAGSAASKERDDDKHDADDDKGNSETSE